MPRGYTLVWSGWERAGTLEEPDAIGEISDREEPRRLADHRPVYEYIVTGGASFDLRIRRRRGQGKAPLTHRVHLNDAPQDVPHGTPGSARLATTTPPAGIRLVNADRRRGQFIDNDIYEFKYTAKDPTVNGLGFAAVRDWNAWLRYETQDDSATPTRWPATSQKIYTEISSQPGRLLNDFRHLGFNEAENGKKVFDGHMQWIAAGNGFNMNYRFSQSGRTERNRQNHLYIEGRFPFANVHVARPDHRQHRQPLQALPADQHLPARRGDLLGERVLGEVGVAAAHRPRRLARSAGLAVHPQLPDV